MKTRSSLKWHSLVYFIPHHEAEMNCMKFPHNKPKIDRTWETKLQKAENAHRIILKQNYNYRLTDESDGMIVYLPVYIHVHWLNDNISRRMKQGNHGRSKFKVEYQTHGMIERQTLVRRNCGQNARYKGSIIMCWKMVFN